MYCKQLRVVYLDDTALGLEVSEIEPPSLQLVDGLYESDSNLDHSYKCKCERSCAFMKCKCK